jgi:hypothetical protein
MPYALLLVLVLRFDAGIETWHEAPLAEQQFSVRYPTSELIASKSAA